MKNLYPIYLTKRHSLHKLKVVSTTLCEIYKDSSWNRINIKLLADLVHMFKQRTDEKGNQHL